MAAQTEPSALLIERPLAAFRTGAELYARRTQAVFDYFSALPHVREPQDLAALQSGYWTRAIDDYSSALLQAMGAGEAAPQAQGAAPRDDAQAA